MKGRKIYGPKINEEYQENNMKKIIECLTDIGGVTESQKTSSSCRE